jgi:hypothetical protein
MPTAQTRKCTLLDAMALVAATAIGLGLTRAYSLEVLNNNLEPYPLVPRILLTIWAWILAIFPIPVLWSIALFGLFLRRPRPPLRRLVRQPGFVAAASVTLVAAVRLAGFATLVARTFGNQFNTLVPSVFDALTVTVTYRGPMKIATIYNSAYFATSAFGISMAVSAAWLLLAASGRWRLEPKWLDRVGCCLGTFWIAIIPFSCWWDYHVLY